MRITSGSASTPLVSSGLVVGVGVVGREADDDPSIAFLGLHEGDRRRSTGRRDLDPAAALAERGIKALLEPERFDVEVQCPFLVADRDDHGSDPSDTSGVCHRVPPWSAPAAAL
jgi:hypothetical protein